MHVSDDDSELRKQIALNVENGRVLLLVDNVSNNHLAACEALAAYLSKYADVHAILTAQRASDVNPSLISASRSSWQMFDLAPLGDSDVKRFVTTYFGSGTRPPRGEAPPHGQSVINSIKAHPNEADLFRTPLFLRMYCELIDRSGENPEAASPPSRHIIYRRFINGFLDHVHDPELGADSVHVAQAAQDQDKKRFPLLVDLAWELSSKSQDRFSYSRSEVMDALSKSKKSLRNLSWAVDEAFKHLTVEKPVLIPDPPCGEALTLPVPSSHVSGIPDGHGHHPTIQQVAHCV